MGLWPGVRASHGALAVGPEFWAGRNPGQKPGASFFHGPPASIAARQAVLLLTADTRNCTSIRRCRSRPIWKARRIGPELLAASCQFFSWSALSRFNIGRIGGFRKNVVESTGPGKLFGLLKVCGLVVR